jgi:hypothetical protein
MSSAVPRTFRGLKWEPSNEQEVVVLFGRLLDKLPKPIAIEFVQTGFPDCRAINVGSEEQEPIWIEFELYSSHYREHLNRREVCHWVVCWHNDGDGGGRTIVALDEVVDKQPNPQEYVLNRRPRSMTDQQYFELRISDLPEHQQRVIQQLLEFAATSGLRVDWPKTNGACFTVRDSREVPTAVKTDLVRRLNETFSAQFSPGGKISVDIGQLLPDRDAVNRYIQIWRHFVLGRQSHSAL